jgi:hypothetical protein
VARAKKNKTRCKKNAEDDHLKRWGHIFLCRIRSLEGPSRDIPVPEPIPPLRENVKMMATVCSEQKQHETNLHCTADELEEEPNPESPRGQINMP